MTENLNDVITKQGEIGEAIELMIKTYDADREAKKGDIYIRARIDNLTRLKRQLELNHDIIKSFNQPSKYLEENTIDKLKQKLKIT